MNNPSCNVLDHAVKGVRDDFEAAAGLVVDRDIADDAIVPLQNAPVILKPKS